VRENKQTNKQTPLSIFVPFSMLILFALESVVIAPQHVSNFCHGFVHKSSSPKSE
jgi:hypothetical protein